MQQAIREGFDLAQQLMALPFKMARQAFRETALSRRPTGEVLSEALCLGEDLAKLPWKAAAALVAEVAQPKPDLAARVAHIERHLGLSPGEQPAPAPEPASPSAPASAPE